MEKKIYTLEIANPNYKASYGSNFFSWHLCTVPNKGSNDTKLLSHAYRCREGLVEALYNVMKEGKQGQVVTSKEFVFVASRQSNMKMKAVYPATPYAARYEEVTKESERQYGIETNTLLEKGIRLLNLFEKAAGWAPSKAYRTRVKMTGAAILPKNILYQATVYYFVKVPRQWLMAPQTISLLFLILRNGVQPLFPEFENIEEVNKAIKKGGGGALSTRGLISRVAYLSDDHYINNSFRVAVPMMRDVEKLFEKDMVENWRGGAYANTSPFMEGMHCLLSGRSINVSLGTKFKSIRRKWTTEARVTAFKETMRKKNESKDSL